MTRLVCPFCGPRELEEFRFRKTLPELGASAYAEVYERANRVGECVEHWHHLHGCRAWLLVRRNPSSGDVHSVALLGGALA